MKALLYFFLFYFFLANVSFVKAATTPTPTTTPIIQHTNEFTVQNDPNTIVGTLKSYIQGFDSLLGGFIFYTPDPMANTITLKDNSELPGLAKYRNMFYDISIPLLVIIISAIAFIKIGSDDVHHLKSFVKRFFITVALFVTVPFILSYSVQFNNLLVKQVSSTQELTGFISNYFDQTQNLINSGQEPQQYGIPQYDISFIGGIFKSLGKFIVQIFLFILTFLFLLGGFMYIGFQFVIRFATLMFLGVLYPIIIPFILSEKTEKIVYTFFKTWFIVLIQQPAFVLGFAITSDLFNSILNAKGPSVGLLFFYTGFLFFLAGVNVLVARIFGSGWDAMSLNFQAMVASRTFTQPVQSSIRDFKRGLVGGQGSVSHTTGKVIHDRIASHFQKDSKKKEQTEEESDKDDANMSSIPPFSQELNEKGIDIESINKRQGVVAVSGETYQYNDPKTNLSTLYPTRFEGIQDGVPAEKLEKIQLASAQFIDLSAFNKQYPNPHNLNAMDQSIKQGKELHFAYIESQSHPERVKNFLDVSQQRNKAFGVQGVIVKRQGTKTTDQIIRLYTQKPNEKRTNL